MSDRGAATKVKVTRMGVQGRVHRISYECSTCTAEARVADNYCSECGRTFTDTREEVR